MMRLQSSEPANGQACVFSITAMLPALGLEEAGEYMTLFETAEAVRSSRWASWGLAVVAFGVALATRFAFDHILPAGFPYITFFPAVILTTFFAGVRAGVACAIACGLAAWYWFIPPIGGFALNSSVLIALGFYAGIIAVDILLIHAMRVAVNDLRDEKVKTRDLLAQKEVLLAEQTIRQEQQRVLQYELSHRMKNTLSMVQAVVSQSLRNASDPVAASALASARIQALSRAQDALTATDWSAADVEAGVLSSIAPHADRSDRFVITGPPVELEARRSLGLALAIHELATNATKYGSLSNDVGRVVILWDVLPDGTFRFSWREVDGPAVTAPSRRGFGERLIENVVPAYFRGRAEVAYETSGLQYELIGTTGDQRPD